jgi:hypothetical protein
MMSAAVLDEGFARKVMIASHDSGGELIASQSTFYILGQKFSNFS